jgi:predicted GNAT family acetyltransferase
VPVTRHADADAFLAAAASLTSVNAAVGAFVTMLVAQWRTTGRNVDGGYAATYADPGIRGFALASPGGVAVLENSAPAAARAFAQDMPEALRGIVSVHGERDACTAFTAAWCARWGHGWQEAAHLRHHRLGVIAPVPMPSGTVRAAGDDDLEWLTEMSLAFAQEARIPDARDIIVQAVQRRLAAGRYRIWDDHGRVAFAAWAPAGDVAARIAPVYTLADSRCRGYATALVAALARELRAAGRGDLFLMTDVTNPTSNAIYARIGFRPVSDSYRFDFIPAPA